MSSQVRRAAALIVTVGALLLLMLVSLPGPASGAPAPKFTEVSAAGTVVNGDLRQVIASCAHGYHVTGGGYEIESINPALFVHQDAPLNPDVTDSEWGWAVTILNETGVSVNFTVIALCAKD